MDIKLNDMETTIKSGDRVAIMSHGTQRNGTVVGVRYNPNMDCYRLGNEIIVDLDNGHTTLTDKNNIVKL